MTNASRLSRRDLLTGGAVASAGAAAALVGERALGAHETRVRAHARAEALAEAERLRGSEVIPFHGEHQAGIETHPQAHQSLVALALRDTATTPTQLRRMLSALTTIASRMTRGEAGDIDTEPELALLPARLTVTFGFGRGLVDVVGSHHAPEWLQGLPAFEHDALRSEWSGGDLVMQVAADDPVTVSHATRQLLKTAREFTTMQWVQHGFRRAYGVEPAERTQRNLMGQVDGTANAAPGSEHFSSIVWGDGAADPAWLRGGTGFVVRRIRMLLDRWDHIDRSGREQAIGRRIDNGAPLTGVREHDEPDFEATDALGFPAIGEYAHIRRARSDNPRERIYRRNFNYDLAVAPGSSQMSDSGLIFTSYQHDVAAQFTPIQRRLDELDLMNEWITHIGSAVFAMPPGCTEDGFIGETLFQ